jgi:hypothetical protein
MTLATSTLRPGLLVSLSTSCRGNVNYAKVDLDEQHTGITEIVKWETTRTIADAVEFEAAKKAQSKARSIICSVCTSSAFGLLCPERDADVLEAAIRDAQYVIDAFNEKASLTRLRLYVMTGKIAQDDVEAVRKINSEIRDLLDDMSIGVQKLDVERIRAAANQAREVGKMLTPQAQANVQIAIDTARAAAKQIVKAGEAAAIEVDTLALRKIADQRTMFLDMSDEIEISAPAAQARAIDLAPDMENDNAV